MKTDDLIKDLTTDLRPVRRLPSSTERTLYWLIPLLLASASLLLGLERPDALETLNVKSERLEVVIATATSIVAAYAAFTTSSPNEPNWISYLPLPFLTTWLTLLALEFSTVIHDRTLTVEDFLPARACILLLISFSVLPMITLTVMLRRAAPILACRTAVLASVASGSFSVLMLRLVLYHPTALMPEMFTEDVGGLVLPTIFAGIFHQWLLPQRPSCPGEY